MKKTHPLIEFINKQAKELTYEEVYVHLRNNPLEVAAEYTTSVNLFLDLAALKFDPSNHSYPFSEKIQSIAHAEMIEQIRPHIEHPDTAWLMHDFHWTQRRKPEYAGLAAEQACKSAVTLDPTKYGLEILNRIKRALILSGMSGDKDTKKNVRDSLKNLTEKSLTVPDSFLPVRLINLLIEVDETEFLLEIQEASKISKAAESAEATHDWELAHALRQSSIAVLRLNKLEEKAQKAIFDLAQSFHGDASRSVGMKSAFTYQKAIQALQKINLPPLHKERDEQIEKLQLLLQSSQLAMTKELKPITVPFDTTPFLASLEEVMNKARSFEESLLLLAARFPLRDQKVMESNISQHSQTLIHSLFEESQIVDERGRTKQRPSSSEELLAQKVNQELDLGWKLTGRVVEHGRRLLSARYSVTESDWMSMLIANPFIPNGHHEIIAKGLHQGFNCEWIYPTHLLPPQFEASIRHILESHSIPAQNITLGSKQKDFLLKELLLHPKISQYINEDFCFEISRLLTEDGLNLRNDGLHGKLNFLSFYTARSVYLWYLSIKFFCFGPLLLNPKSLAQASKESEQT